MPILRGVLGKVPSGPKSRVRNFIAASPYAAVPHAVERPTGSRRALSDRVVKACVSAVRMRHNKVSSRSSAARRQRGRSLCARSSRRWRWYGIGSRSKCHEMAAFR
jgi:hypothetical protein